MIDNLILEQIFQEFIILLYKDKNYKITSFKKDKEIDKWENYKYEVRRKAKDKLLTKFWKVEDIGTGKILEKTKKAIDTHIIYNGKRIDNNLIDWRKKDNFTKLKNDKKLEKVLFDFFKSKEKDENKSFNYFLDLGLSYQMIAYLFFIKDHQKYLPISQERFDFIFQEIGINFKTSGRVSWDNYQEFISIIKTVQKFLKSKNIETYLLDAHSFLWIWGWLKKEKNEKEQIDTEKLKTEINEVKENSENLEKQEIPEIEQKEQSIETYANLDDSYFLERLRLQMEKGHIAEEVALKYEKDKLLTIGRPDLADKVKIVSEKAGLGYDILSYELNNKQEIEMQIEVKSVNNGDTKRFFITRNELNKSRQLSNYYIYLIENANTDNSTVFVIKHPNLLNKDEFQLETISYEVKYQI